MVKTYSYFVSWFERKIFFKFKIPLHVCAAPGPGVGRTRGGKRAEQLLRVQLVRNKCGPLVSTLVPLHTA